MHALQDVDERAAGPHRGIEGCKLVVTHGNHRGKVLFENVLVFPQRRIRVEEQDALSLRSSRIA